MRSTRNSRDQYLTEIVLCLITKQSTETCRDYFWYGQDSQAIMAYSRNNYHQGVSVSAARVQLYRRRISKTEIGLDLILTEQYLSIVALWIPSG